MGTASPFRVGWLVAAVYLVLIVECFSLGFISHATLAEVLDHSSIEVQRRSPPVVIILTLLAAVLLGYLGTLPFLCYAVQRRSPHALVPYLIWRALLSILVVAVVVWQLVLNQTSSLFRTTLFGRPAAFILSEVFLGAFFFFVVLLAYREFSILQMERDRTPERDAVA